MLDAAGAKGRLAGCRGGAWLISPLTGWKWAVFANGAVEWLPSTLELPVSLRVSDGTDKQVSSSDDLPSMAGSDIDYAPSALGSTMRSRSAVMVTVLWSDEEEHEIRVTKRDWQKVISGKPLTKRGKGYYVEGVFFWDYWAFEGGIEGSLRVTYTGAGVGFDGKLSDADLEPYD